MAGARTQSVHIVIVGGGMVGAALALALVGSHFRVTLLERQPPAPWAPEQPHDLRVSAISPGSAALLDQLGAWNAVLARRATPYASLRVWEQRGVGDLHITAKEMGCEALGHIVENRLVQLALWEQLEHQDQIEIRTPCEIRSIHYSPEGSELCFANGDRLRCQLLIGADGAASAVRDSAGMGVQGWSYPQHALIAYVAMQTQPLAGTWQRFLPSGPQALLPLSAGHASLVWYERPERIQSLLALSDADLVTEIEAAFPEELGRICTLRERAFFPLKRQHATEYGKPGVVLLGDAAHTIHPLAGQGVNLGFKDVAVLAELLRELEPDALTSAGWITQYEQRRRPDNSLMMNSMELIQRGFGNDIAPVRFLRNAVLALAEYSGPVKQQAVRWAMGL